MKNFKDNLFYDINWAYWAGIFDGEGYVGILYHKYAKHYALRASIGMCNREIIEKLHTEVGGNHYKRGMYNSKGEQVRKRPIWYWYTQGKNAKQFLGNILEYSIVKREQIEAALEFPLAPSRRRLPSKIMQKRKELEFILKDLKKPTEAELHR